MNRLVLYHDNCPDGYTAAWAAWKRFGDQADYLPVNYGQEAPLTQAVKKNVLLVDFCYPRATLDELANVAETVTIYDHHLTAQVALQDWTRGTAVFDMKRSGAGITWDELHSEPHAWFGKRPALIAYVEDRDLWRWALEGSREINEYILSVPRHFNTWCALAIRMQDAYELATIRAEGATLLRAKQLRVETLCRQIQWMRFGDLTIPVVNAASDQSEIGEYLCAQFPEFPCGGYYFDRADKRQWGFRSHGPFDVAQLCQRYGGGGHQKAAGFVSAIGWRPEEHGGAHT